MEMTIPQDSDIPSSQSFHTITHTTVVIVIEMHKMDIRLRVRSRVATKMMMNEKNRAMTIP